MKGTRAGTRARKHPPRALHRPRTNFSSGAIPEVGNALPAQLCELSLALIYFLASEIKSCN